MKSLIWGDLHGHNYREFSYIDDFGVNSRLKDCCLVLEEIEKSGMKNNVEEVWFLGDTLHLKNNADSQVIKWILGFLGNMAEKFPILIVPGNHDFRSWSSEPILLELLEEYVNKNIRVINESGWINDVYIEPFTRRVKELNERIEELESKENAIFFGHQDIKGTTYGGFKVENGLDPDVLSKKFKWSFIGHWHTPRKVRENVISVGAPLQHNFGDVGEKRGWWIFDGNETEFIENTFSPKFWNIKYSKDEQDISLPGDIEKDFYRIKIIGNEAPDLVKKIRWKRISYESLVAGKSRSKIRFSDSRQSIVNQYVELKAPEEMDKNRLIEIGLKYL